MPRQSASINLRRGRQSKSPLLCLPNWSSGWRGYNQIMKAIPATFSGLALLALAVAQQPVEQKPAAVEPPDARITVEVTRVNVLFTVTDKKGRFITDLG